MDVVEASLADGLHALDSGQISSVELTAVMLDRIARYDRQTIALNGVPVLNRDVFEEAAASDARRRAGQVGSHLVR
jgi:amidase